MRFECQRGCTACCEQKGFVYLTEGDLARAAVRQPRKGEHEQRPDGWQIDELDQHEQCDERCPQQGGQSNATLQAQPKNDESEPNRQVDERRCRWIRGSGKIDSEMSFRTGRMTRIGWNI